MAQPPPFIKKKIDAAASDSASPSGSESPSPSESESPSTASPPAKGGKMNPPLKAWAKSKM